VIPDVDAVLLDVGGTLVAPAPPGTPTDALRARPLPGVRETVNRLAAHHRLAAVTDTSVMREDDVRRILAAVGLDQHLEVVVTSVDVGARKPDPRGVLSALQRLGVSAERALLAGDSVDDRDAAARAGIAFVATDRGLPDAIERAIWRRRGAFADATRAVQPIDDAAEHEATQRHARLAKPVGALGRLETLAAQLAAIARRCPPSVARRPAVAVFAGDHGVVASGVTPWPQEVTAVMARHMAAGRASINAIARTVGASVHVIDVGIATPLPPTNRIASHVVRRGTADLAHDRAMTTAEACAAVDAGIRVARDLVAGGSDLLVTGDMGIGNTTPSAALVAALTRTPASTITGRGTGIDDETLAQKTSIVEQAAARAAQLLDPLSILADVGGLEIAALAGFIVGGAEARVPVVIDGVITAAALLVAASLVPSVTGYCIAGHDSVEPGCRVALDHVGLVPLLDLALRLGEGTGAALAVPIVRAAAAVLAETALLEDAPALPSTPRTSGP
jgi:nicotinate-nucleotide--dimethylbenzimidazole phosphoribosyltransferase